MNNGAAPYLREYGLAPSDSPLLPDWARDSLMGLGLAHADRLSTVSPGYAREILTPSMATGWKASCRRAAERLTGILNGLDLAQWDPAHDRSIAARFEPGTLGAAGQEQAALAAGAGPAAGGRARRWWASCRAWTRRRVLTWPSRCCASLLEAGEAVQVAVLGTGLPAIEAAFKGLARDFPGQVGLSLRFDAGLARQMYAGADMILVPSRYEPCGLAQMIAQRYGAAPIVRRTGGLRDTVIDASRPRRGTGFMFAGYNSAALLSAVRRALRLYRRPASWQALQRRGMRLAESFSWARSAQAYVGLYAKAIDDRKEMVAQLAKATADLAARA